MSIAANIVPPNPEVGLAVRIRNRLATVRAVEPYDHPKGRGRLHLVDVEYLDDWQYPETEQLLWEAEKTAKVLGKTSLPGVDANRPDSPDALRAFVNAHRWTRLNRLRESDDLTGEPILSVWNSAIQVHAYQLEPVLKALTMPRVSLLLADGVGLGKTIQAGLVLEELLIRRRIRRILVLCPAMLQRQWKYELRRKFNLDFEIIDSDSTFQLRRRLGIDTNPWRAFPRIITSMDYLRMPDVLGQFLQASGAGPEADSNGGRVTAHAPWDLLIVDEAHHFAPQGGRRASQRTTMLREIRFLFEHRLFASATPHNGKTVCFTGLLELLDPIRFQMATDMDDNDRANLAEVRIRRLKEDINRQSIRPPFAEQLPPVELKLNLSPAESALHAALREYRRHGQAALGKASASERWLGQFIYSLLTKRLLSCPFAFARTWWRHLESRAEDDDETELFDMAKVSAERAEEQAKSDEERSKLEEDAARYSGAYFRGRGRSTEDLQRGVSNALDALGYDRKTVEAPDKMATLARKSDSKTERLVGWIKDNLFRDGKLRPDERLIVFTEYKETLFHLEQRLLREGFDKNTLRLLYGGMGAEEFEKVKSEFEDSGADVRLLLATDAASEGINMQESCRWIVHYDIPWSPSRLQQRNGRVSRHGQARDVSVHYFRCDQEEDMDFLFHVAQKVEQVRQDLGSVERIFDAAIQRHFRGERTSMEQVEKLVDEDIAHSPDKVELGQSTGDELNDLTQRAKRMLEATDTRLGITAPALAEILKAAIAVEGRGALEEIEGRPGFYRLKPPPRWEGLARRTLTTSGFHKMELVFDSALVEEEVSGRRVLRLKKHQILLRLGHPIMRQAMAVLSRQLHDPAGHDPIHRWSVAALRRTGFDALLVFHYTVTAINELREPLHDEVVSRVFRIEGDRLASVEPDFEWVVLQDQHLPIRSEARRDDWAKAFRGRWLQHRRILETFRKDQESSLRDELQAKADATRKREEAAVKESYRHRLKELQDRSREEEIKKLARKLAEEQEDLAQPSLFKEIQEESRARLQDIEEQMAVLRQDVERTRDHLTRERDRRLNGVLPRRFALREVRVLPLALTYLVPAAAEDLER